MLPRPRKKWPLLALTSPFSGFWPGLGCALLVYGLSSVGAAANLEGIALDALFRARGARDADPRVVIIAVDDAAVVRAGERTGAGWPLPRSYYARAVTDLTRLGAQTIAFDVLFSEPGPNPRQDRELVISARRAANTVQACAFQVPARRGEIAPNLAAVPLSARFSLGSDNFSAARPAVWATAPLPELSAAARSLGHVNVFPEASGTLRRAPHLLSWRGQMFPSLSLATAAQFLGEKPRLDAKNAQITLAGRQIPLDGDGFTFVNWIGAGDAYPKWSLNQLLDGQIPPDAIRGRAVILGVTALGAYENRATPFAGGIPAVDFQANALDDILSNRLLKPASATLGFALILGFSLLCAFATARRGGKNLWPVPVLMGFLLLVALLCLRANFYLPVAAPLLSGALAFGLTAALGYRREWESVARFDASASSLARGTTLLGAALGTPDQTDHDATRDKARLLEIIRTTALETLGAREVFLVFDDENADPRALLAAQQAQNLARAWRFPTREKAAPDTAILRGQTLVAAPLRVPTPIADAPESTPSKPHFAGALVAIGTRSGAHFTARDALMLETLAEGAALALENFRYSNALRGRVESANLELEGAYQMLAEQSAKLFAAVESMDSALVISNARGETAFVNARAAAILRAATPQVGQSVALALKSGELPAIAALFETLAPENVAPSAEKRSPAAENAFPQLENAFPQMENVAPQSENASPQSENAFPQPENAFPQPENAAASSTHLEIARENQLLAAQWTPLWSEQNGFLGAMLVVSDVTAQRELEKMKTEFVGFVAHELRTPLTTILGYASLLERMAGHFSPAETRDMTQTVSRHCRRMNSMISDLLDLSRLESGVSLPIRRESFDLAALCERLITEQKTYLNPSPPREIRFETDAKPLIFDGDSDRIEQVMLNLLTNAVKYSPDGGLITVSLRCTGAELTISVRDEGLGLSQSQIARLFQKFYRTPDSKARGIKGNGLGLNLVRQIVEAHGGAISAISGRDMGEKGSTFEVVFPLEA